MKLANIVPPQWEGVFFQGEYRMALAHWVLKYPNYAKALRKGISYIIMDNGSFENQRLSYPELNKACAQIGADEVVLPDEPGNPGRTLRLSWEVLGKLAAKRVMFVPHGTTYSEWENCLKAWISKWDEARWSSSYSLAIGITSLRQSSNLRKPQLGTRVGLLQKYATLGLPYPLHLLGVPSPSSLALVETESGSTSVRGIDTSLAFALAVRGKLLTPLAPKIPLGEPEQYVSLATHHRRLVYLNQRILRGWVETGETKKIPACWIRQVASKWLKYWAVGFAPLEDVMRACGMPAGRYALRRKRNLEQYVRLISDDDSLEPNEVELKWK